MLFMIRIVINIMNMNNFELPSALFYCNISESQFITSFNKFITDQDPVNADDFPLDEAISYCLFNRIEVILSIQRIFLENELEQIKQFITKYKNYHLLSEHHVWEVQITFYGK